MPKNWLGIPQFCCRKRGIYSVEKCGIYSEYQFRWIIAFFDNWRRGRDSNPGNPKGSLDFESSPFGHSGTSPNYPAYGQQAHACRSLDFIRHCVAHPPGDASHRAARLRRLSSQAHSATLAPLQTTLLTANRLTPVVHLISFATVWLTLRAMLRIVLRGFAACRVKPIRPLWHPAFNHRLKQLYTLSAPALE